MILCLAENICKYLAKYLTMAYKDEYTTIRSPFFINMNTVLLKSCNYYHTFDFCPKRYLDPTAMELETVHDNLSIIGTNHF